MAGGMENIVARVNIMVHGIIYMVNWCGIMVHCVTNLVI